MVFYFYSCKRNPKDFKNELAKIDALKETETTVAYLSKLNKLRAKASRPEEFLSIAKREYEFAAKDEACNTLLQGIKKTSDIKLIAFLTFIAIEEKNYNLAMPHIHKLYNTEYETLVTEFVFKNANTDIKEKMDYKFLMSAFDRTGDEAFLVDAALTLIANARLKDALALREKRTSAVSAYPHFWAELAFDTGDFSIIFDELKYTLANYELHGAYDEKVSEQTKAHILLAADGNYGLGKVEMARGYWTMYADLFSDANPLVFYDLALTTEDVLERSKALLECVQNFPKFYPATARYVRDYAKYQKKLAERRQALNSAESDVEKFLRDKELYSSDMEFLEMQGQFFILEPEALLTERATKFNDPRFMLELLRFKILQDADFQKYSSQLWQILEAYPENTVAREFAKWYFCKLLQFDEAFNITETNDPKVDAFYAGLQASLLGETSKALESYEAAFNEYGFECASRVNYACTKFLLDESDVAIKTYTDAIKYTKSKSSESKIHYRIAEILVELRDYDRAKGVLQYALQLDQENFLAKSLLQQIPQ